jgi:hypothetical protein
MIARNKVGIYNYDVVRNVPAARAEADVIVN